MRIDIIVGEVKLRDNAGGLSSQSHVVQRSRNWRRGREWGRVLADLVVDGLGGREEEAKEGGAMGGGRGVVG